MSRQETTEEQAKKTTWKELWGDYAVNETTLHGFKYFAMDTVLVRRIIWFVVTMGALGGFIGFCVQRVIYFREFDKNVNVEVKFVNFSI